MKNLLLIMCLIIVIGCNKKNDDITSSNSSFVPKSIVGLTLDLDGSKFFDFEENGNCLSSQTIAYTRPTGKAGYGYTVGKNNSADYSVTYTEKMESGKAGTSTYYWTNSTYTYKIVLAFTSETKGTYSGTMTTIGVSNVKDNNTTTTDKISGSFTLQKEPEQNYAPTNIYSKSLTFNYNIGETFSAFTSTSCTMSLTSSNDVLTKIPTYTYLRQSGKQANFTIKYSIKSTMKLTTKTLIDYHDYDDNVTLIFTSSSGGTFFGNVKAVYSSNYTSAPEISTSEISGTFTLK